MAKNGISTLPTKEARQLAKLALAAQDRANAGYTKTNFDVDLLPTKYVGNDVVKNNHPNGLQDGRPWKE